MADRTLTPQAEASQSRATRSRRRSLRSLRAAGAAALLVAVSILSAAPAMASTVCTGDVCVISNTTNTPLGTITVSVSATNIVTVSLAATSPTLVIGVPFTFPEIPIAGCPGGCGRTSITTTAGIINIDTVIWPPGRVALPNIAVISFLPPGPPMRVRTTGTTVTFTPIQPPGPPA